jgi:hypothetical protein
VVLESGKVDTEASVSLNNASVANLQVRNQRRAEVAVGFWLMTSFANPSRVDLQDTLAGHRVGLLIDTLDIPEVLLLGLVVGSKDDGDNIELEPETGAQRRAHVLERDGETSSNELDKVLMLISLDLGNDVVGDEVLALTHVLIERDVLDGEVVEVDGVMDSEGNDSSVVIGEDGRDTEVEGL